MKRDRFRRVFAGFVAVCAMVCTAVSCSTGEKVSREKYVPEPTEPPTTRTVNDYADGILEGTWTDYEADYTFTADGNIGVEMNITGNIYFTNDLTVMLDGTEIPPENVSYDGTTLSVDADGGDNEVSNLLTLVRVGEADPDNIDGNYIVSGGTLAEQYTSTFGTDDIQMELYWGECYLFVENAGTYTQKGDLLTFDEKGAALFGEDMSESGEIYFVTDGDIFTVYFPDGVIKSFGRR